MKMPSVMAGSQRFAQVPRASIERSAFDRSFGYKTTFDAGYLVPFYCDEALPGDTFTLNSSAFARLATPLKPIMDNMFLETFFFAVPNRLLWSNWQKFNGEQANPDDSTDFVIPQMSAPVGGYDTGSLHDYFGLPINVSYTHSALWHRAYNLIYNEWFRDQNLQISRQVDQDDGPDDPAQYVLLRRGKRHDYFTSCLPWPQKGESVELPLGSIAPLIIQGDGRPVYTSSWDVIGVPTPGTRGIEAISNAGSSGDRWVEELSPGTNLLGTAGTPVAWADPKLAADLSAATAATINELRQAFQVQKLLERDARGGTRYTEIIRSHFGVTSPDARLQRPEYLGGGSSPIIVSPIAQTSGDLAGESIDSQTPQGNLAAIGTASFTGHGFSKSFTEHCILIGIVCVRADLTYQQGVDRMFSRTTRYDFYWPALSHIGEQAVLNREIYVQGTSADADVFGYQERYAEYRYKPSLVTGQFRSGADGGSLDIWHLAQEFGALPELSSTFIEEDPPVDRIIAVPSEPHFLFDSYTRLKCARPMPVYGVPGLIDHF